MDLDVYGSRKKTMTTLKHRTASGVKWSMLSQAGRQGMQLLTIVILARLLTPSDFGLVGMAMVVIGFIGIFNDLGTSAAIIQQRELTETLLSSIFWVNVGFGVLAMIVLYFCAPLGGTFFREPRVVALLRALSLSFFISGLSILQQALLERSLSFSVLAKVEIASVFTGSMVSVGLALAGAGAWSLVFQSLITVSVTTILLWFSSSWRPHWIFRWGEIVSVSNFSLNLTGFNIINYFVRNADNLLIGRYLGAQDLGYYTLAYRILLFPLQNISGVIGRVMFPVLSSFQDDNYRLARWFLKVAESIALIAFPVIFGILAVAKPFILTFFGAQWRPVILLVIIFTPVGLSQSVATTAGSIYQAKGKTDWMFRWGIGSGTFVVIAFLIGLHWGIIGVAVAYAIASLILIYPSFSIPFRLVNLRFVQLLKVLGLPFLNSGLMFVIVIVFRMLLPSWYSDAMVFVFSVSLGIAVYTTASWLTSRELLKELWGLVGFKRIKSDSSS
jgi:O-antigen/teichoic acid export membrane protein